MTISYPSRDTSLLDKRLQALLAEFLSKCAAQGLKVIVTQTHRSAAYQNSLFAQGRTTQQLREAGVLYVEGQPKMPQVTKAKAGTSPHEWTNKDGTPAARAFDIAVFNEKNVIDWNRTDLFAKAGAIGKSVGLFWGGDFKSYKDMPHFELVNWKTLPDV